MKKFLTAMILMILTLTAAAVPALAAEYVSGPEAGLFGKPTSIDPVTVIGGTSEWDNIDRSKNSAFIPPPFGSPAAYTLETGKLLTPNLSGISPYYGAVYDGGMYYPASEPSYPLLPSTRFTPTDGLYYLDGSIGTLSIPILNLYVKVYEDESLSSLRKGVGHFAVTSGWDGNVGFAAHNRGVSDYFGKIHTLMIGDRIAYTTKLGTRTYEVFYVGVISETDFGRLERTYENIVTLITCVKSTPELRWCVQAREIR